MIDAGSLVKEYFKKRNLRGEGESLAYTGIWKRITGKNIGRSTRPVALKEGTLFVEVEDSVWLYELTLLKEKIKADFNAVSGNMVVRDIVFRNTGISLQQKKGGQGPPRLAQKKGYHGETEKFKEVKLGERQKTEITKLIRHMPPSAQQGMGRLLNSFFTYQAWKKEQGAITCPRCRSLYFAAKGAGGKNFCHICEREQ